MKKTQTKDITGKILVYGLIFLVCEVVLGLGLYWPFLLGFVSRSRLGYWLAFTSGLILSVTTGTTLGLMSLVLVVVCFIYQWVKGQVAGNFLTVGISSVLGALLVSWLRGSGINWLEFVLVLGIAAVLWKLEFFREELVVRS